ncbi:MAG: 4Fe-4S binding protein [Candidatus Methanomethylophilus sp.]|nr:4Fe-4S binding protein [Methanomethylophilus sp.]
MRAVRNIRLCTKDCLCLYVCPTGATDTEDGQVDWKKCIGCGMCVKACPNGALSLVPEKYPVQQRHSKEVCDALFAWAKIKVAAETEAKALAGQAKDPVEKQFMKALETSFRRQTEDIYRECGYMLPQSANTRKLLNMMLEREQDPAFPREAVQKLLNELQVQLH